MTDKERKISIAMNVNKDEDLPEAGYNVAEFIAILQENHGDFDVDISVGVNPVIDTEQGPTEKVMGFLAEYEQSVDEDEIEEDYEDDCDDTSRKRSNNRRVRGTAKGTAPSTGKHRKHDRRD